MVVSGNELIVVAGFEVFQAFFQILLPHVQPGCRFEQEALQLLDKMIRSSDPAGEPDIYSILYLRKSESDISDHVSDRVSADASVDQMQGHRGRPGPAFVTS